MSAVLFNRFIQSTRRALLGFLLAGAPAGALASEVLPVEFHQLDTPYNFQAQRGAPISSVTNSPAGSDGRMPTPAQNQSGSNLGATPHQFQGFTPFGGIPSAPDRVVLKSSTVLQAGTTAFSPTVITEMQLPTAKSNGVIVAVLRRAQVGAPYLSRQISFLFGSVIEVPASDENGLLLTNVLKENYWLAEPYSTNGHANAGYYWSGNAAKVYAIQAGQISVTWKKATSTTTQPADFAANPNNYEVDAGHYFRLLKVTYVVSGAPVKTPRKMYWTEKTFAGVGKLVAVPTVRVSSVKVVYSRDFPKTVATEYVAPGQTSPTDGTTNAALPELRTLWFDKQQGNIHAYNQEGRVFVELLGDQTGADTQEQLGFEIVDVFRTVNPSQVAIELGERIVPPAPGTLDTLSPEPVVQLGAPTFDFTHAIDGKADPELYAARESKNLNDYLVHWMEVGEVGLKWPAIFARYNFIWPNDVSKYSHYVRPLVATENEAIETAVPLASENVPTIQWQDPFDTPRAKLTADFKFYTFLNTQYPAHRTLLRFTSGDQISFERVFSWLDVNLKSGAFAATVATNLAAWNVSSNALIFSQPSIAPRVVNATVDVGQRIAAPTGELGGAVGDDYLAGHINQASGTSFNPHAYTDPLGSNAVQANNGAIIPVNAIPGKNLLEVWWFRPNAANNDHGFKTTLWPSVIGRYTLQWPASAPEIVMAGKAGSGPGDSFFAAGTIYSQGDPTQPGYNPNEEHALMSGGVAYALRDDLNITSGANYSSAPYVLVEYTGADNRPTMSVFKVLREKPSAGLVFDYIVKAGTLLQPPMPLPLLPPPVEGAGDNAINYNNEPVQVGDLPVGWNDSVDATGPLKHYRQFTYRDRKHGFWVYRGPHAGLPALQAGKYSAATGTFSPLSPARALTDQELNIAVHTSRESQYLAMTVTPRPSWLSINGVTMTARPKATDVGTNNLQIVVRDIYDSTTVTNQLTLVVATNGVAAGQDPLQLASTNSYTRTVIAFTNRPPFLAASPVPTNSFTMHFYYKTQAGFDWPGVANPPAAGSIVPYLRPLNAAGTDFAGDGAAKTTPSLDIVYRPVWPILDPMDETKIVPTLPFGQTLTEPVQGLPGVRDFKTAEILYQQSIARDFTVRAPSAALHDSTRQKISDLKAQGLVALPGGVARDFFQGKYFFPNLAPHLASRLYYDPNRGANGSLVFVGEFKDDIVGEKYLLSNALRDADLASVKALCPASDANKSQWDALVNALSTTIETFYENPAVPGTYVPNPGLTTSAAVGDLPMIASANTAVDSYALSGIGPGSGYITLLENTGTAFTKPEDPVAIHIMKVGGSIFTGQLKVIPAPNPLSEQVTMQHTADLAGRTAEYEYEWKIGAPVDGLPPQVDATMSRYLPLVNGTNVNRFTIGGAGIRALSDNYLVMRYRAVAPGHPLQGVWSDWTDPQLAEGWIKRVLAGINPFNQRTSDLLNNRVNTDATIIQQAGHRWEGDVALNADTLNNHGLIEIYETVLRRGRALSIESGYNYGPANDALLLAAGYLNDLYMTVGNEAASDAANPTIGIGTKDRTYGDIATALFAFKGQVPTLLDEELSLLRGRDDFLQPSVQVAPFYNRLVWNYTRGIDSGEVIYALNYNVLDQNNDGVVDATDAALLYPQAHGDAYGHFLTALSGYYSLLMNPNFDWVPRIEAVSVLGEPVSVDYLDERKFAAASLAVARTAQQIFDLTWRDDFQSGQNAGWRSMSTNRVNSSRVFTMPDGTKTNSVRNWGMDHWASRGGQGAYLNWVIGNAIVPAVDPNPAHEGIQKIDRTTIPELQELASIADSIQTDLENAESRLTPLGLPAGALAFDINPNQITGVDTQTHFEQVYQRAKIALNNAVAAFDDAKDVTRLMRSEQDSLQDFKTGVEKQELAYTNSLVELYGTPYTDDIGPGKLYSQGYAGPDLFHFAYVDSPELTFPGMLDPTTATEYRIDIQKDIDGNTVGLPTTFLNISVILTNGVTDSPFIPQAAFRFALVQRALANNPEYKKNVQYISYTLDSKGNFIKPPAWNGHRASPGKIQDAIGRILLARTAAAQALQNSDNIKKRLDASISYLQANVIFGNQMKEWDDTSATAQATLDSILEAGKIAKLIYDQYLGGLKAATDAAEAAIPKENIFGLANGGDLLSAARSAILANYGIQAQINGPVAIAKEIILGTLKVTKDSILRFRQADDIDPAKRELVDRQQTLAIQQTFDDLHQSLFTINHRLDELDAPVRNYQALTAEGDRIQQERQVFRQRSAAIVQGFRSRDAAFRLFRDEKLERYKTLFDLSARYTYLAANAYDYETGLLNTDTGRQFINRIINSRALGVVRDGEPQFAGSDTGDPGLSSVLAEMKSDWDVLKGRLGFNNPDAYGTTASLRMENYRILPGTNGVANWQDLMRQTRRDNLLDDPEIRRYCMQIDRGDGAAVPGLVFEFSTTIEDGYNLFGQTLAAGDHAYSPSSFATKIFAVGAALEGYRGMSDPSANSGAVTSAGGSSPTDPDAWYLDPLGLSATPYIYLIPVGQDAMRTPPLGDSTEIRNWTVNDMAIPLPFNIGASDFSTNPNFLASDSLTEPMFALRKHQAFRPVSSASLFSADLYTGSGGLQRSQFTNNRLIGRSAWNTRWKLVIPGNTLLNDPKEGLDRFIQTVTDIKIHFVTYSYAGN